MGSGIHGGLTVSGFISLPGDFVAYHVFSAFNSARPGLHRVINGFAEIVRNSGGMAT